MPERRTSGEFSPVGVSPLAPALSMHDFFGRERTRAQSVHAGTRADEAFGYFANVGVPGLPPPQRARLFCSARRGARSRGARWGPFRPGLMSVAPDAALDFSNVAGSLGFRAGLPFDAPSGRGEFGKPLPIPLSPAVAADERCA